MQINRGTIVVATRQISEKNFAGKREHVHAKKGDRGVVLSVGDDYDDLLNVRFERTGTATIVGDDEVTVLVKVTARPAA